MNNDLIFALLFVYFVVIPVFMFTFWDDKNKYFPDSFQESFIKNVLRKNENINLFGNTIVIIFKLGCTLPYLIIYYMFAIVLTIIFYILKFLFHKRT